MFKPPLDLNVVDCRALTMVMCEGSTKKQACRETGISLNRLNALLSRSDIQEIGQQLFKDVVFRLNSLGEIVAEKFRLLLESENEYIVSGMIDKWMRMQAMFTDVREVRLTAEDVVKQLLQNSSKMVPQGDQMRTLPEPVQDADFDVFEGEKAKEEVFA